MEETQGQEKKEGQEHGQGPEQEPEKSAWAKREEEILESWQDRGIFEKTLEKNEGKKHFVFYDGPPFATGLPHYGHLLASVIKDAIPRYQTMKGKYVRRVWGWDCHGLPVETLIEKELGLEHKKNIEEYGVGKFNKAAQESVLRYDAEWKKMIPRVGRFIDMEHSYRTMDAKYTESIWWAFKEMYGKGLVYKGYKSMHICPRCETTLSSSEVAQGYKDITDISVTVKFEMVDHIRTDGSKEPASNGASELKTYLLAWTTTPWTLPGNVALAVNPDEDYLILELEAKDTEEFPLSKGEKIIFLENTDAEIRILGGALGYGPHPHENDISWANVNFKGKGNVLFKNIKSVKGKDLIGKAYKPPFEYFSGSDIPHKENGWKVYAGDFVTTESGTGIVHIAPAFGEDDMAFGKKYNLPFVQHISFDGVFTKDVKDFVGLFVKPKDNPQATDIEIIKYLAHKGILFAKEKITHSYPHCWRCDTPLLNYATSSWFIAVTGLRDKLVALNKKISWVPETVGEGRFGNWLENARDWPISRTRFWGAPLPVWECSTCSERRVLGSVKEIGESAPPRNTYFAMRHGEAESNVNNIVSSKPGNGHHLTEKGKEQIAHVLEELKKKNIDIIVSSPFLRTKETAKLVSEGLGKSESDIVFDERLKEIDTGVFNDKAVADYRAYFSSTLEKLTKRPAEGENLVDVKRRMMDAVAEIEREHKGKTILLLSHEYPIWALFAAAQGVSKEETAQMKESAGDDFIGNAEVREISYAPVPRNEDMELDLHRPYIDDIKFPCTCGGVMVRVPEVFDCWVESGSMPFAQFHYPFENKKEFDNNFPADFIAEGLDQTRGWFYTMLVLGAALFGGAPYKNVVVNGLILAGDGRKMSKRLKNYPEPLYVVHKYGADALRLYLLSSPVVRGEELRFSEKDVDEVQKKVIGRLLNVVSFYELYKDDAVSASGTSTDALDMWILACLRQTISGISESLDHYELDRATRPISIFVDDLSTWYLRRSRERFKGEDSEDKRAALATTRFVLREFSKAIAPFAPFLAEDVYRRVNGKSDSVHLEEWPRSSFWDNIRREPEVLKEMEEVRRIVSLGLEARASAGIKVRQPLAKLTVKGRHIADDLLDLIRNEVNVKDVGFAESLSEHVVLDTEITPELEREGYFRELVRAIQDLRKKEGFVPSDLAVIRFDTSADGRALVEEFGKSLRSATPTREVEFGGVSDGEVVALDGLEFRISIAK